MIIIAMNTSFKFRWQNVTYFLYLRLRGCFMLFNTVAICLVFITFFYTDYMLMSILQHFILQQRIPWFNTMFYVCPYSSVFICHIWLLQSFALELYSFFFFLLLNWLLRLSFPWHAISKLFQGWWSLDIFYIVFIFV